MWISCDFLALYIFKFKVSKFIKQNDRYYLHFAEPSFVSIPYTHRALHSELERCFETFLLGLGNFFKICSEELPRSFWAKNQNISSSAFWDKAFCVISADLDGPTDKPDAMLCSHFSFLFRGCRYSRSKVKTDVKIFFLKFARLNPTEYFQKSVFLSAIL